MFVLRFSDAIIIIMSVMVFYINKFTAKKFQSPPKIIIFAHTRLS